MGGHGKLYHILAPGQLDLPGRHARVNGHWKGGHMVAIYLSPRRHPLENSRGLLEGWVPGPVSLAACDCEQGLMGRSPDFLRHKG